MKNKKILLLCFLSLPLAFLGAMCGNDSGQSANASPEIISASFTMNQLSQHNSDNDCWIAINNKVYDITAFISAHPGGEDEITQACGLEATQMFNDQGHPQRANELISDYYIGDLQN